MRDDSDRVIPLAELVARKGIPQKNTFKADAYSGSALLFKDKTRFFYRPDAEGDFVEVSLLSSFRPLGAKWEEARSFLVTFPDGFDVKLGAQIALSRSDFPALKDGEKTYLCDLIQFTVEDLEGRCFGELHSFFWQGPKECESISLVFRVKGQLVEVPWRDDLVIKKKERIIVYPDFSVWLGEEEK